MGTSSFIESPRERWRSPSGAGECDLESTDPASSLGPFTAPVEFEFTETISVPNDATESVKRCELRVIADGAERVKQTITANVEFDSSSTDPPPDASSVPTKLRHCKDNRWKRYEDASGNKLFESRSDCRSYVRAHRTT